MPIIFSGGLSVTGGYSILPLPLELTVVTSSSSFTAGTAITPYTPITLSNGIGSETWSINPSLPSGLSISSSTGEISGTPDTITSSTTFTITVSNVYGSSSKTTSIEVIAPVGQVAYTSAGTFSWTVPTGVTSISVVCVGGGQAGGNGRASNAGGGTGGSGGQLAYTNTISVTPGATFTVYVGAGGSGGVGTGNSGGFSGLHNGAGYVSLAYGGGVASTPGVNTHWSKGGTGGAAQTGGTYNPGGGGGGAAGYSSSATFDGTVTGGNGGTDSATLATRTGDDGRSGMGGGAGGSVFYSTTAAYTGGGGGGTGIFGQGAEGTGVAPTSNSAGGNPGSTGGSPTSTKGGNGSTGTAGAGGFPGGGGGGGKSSDPNIAANGAAGGGGAVRIIWPGDLRYFPTTRTADE